jgi:hypothetical protein
MEKRKVILGTFPDIEGAFDSTSFDIKRMGAKWHRLGDTICWRNVSMLGGRKITATLAGGTLQRCGQVLSAGGVSITSTVQPSCC